MAAIRCPLCDVPMREVTRRDVLIDVCPECRGIWLDRGELDKLLGQVDEWERHRDDGGPVRWPDRPRRGEDDRDRYEPRKPKKKSLWKELFDFD